MFALDNSVHAHHTDKHDPMRMGKFSRFNNTLYVLCKRLGRKFGKVHVFTRFSVYS